jgi:hypothetical protein
VPDRHPHRVFDQGQHGDANSGLTQNYFSRSSILSFVALARTGRGVLHRERATMKSPVVLVSATLAFAILLAVSLLIATGTRGDDAAPPLTERARASVME